MKTNVRTPLQRVLSMLLCVAMLLSVPVVPVGATGTEPADDVIPETTAPAETETEIVDEEGVDLLAIGPETVGYSTGYIPTVTSAESGIDFNLYNYSTYINQVSSQPDAELRSYFDYFAFRGTYPDAVYTYEGRNGAAPHNNNTEYLQLVWNHLRYNRNLNENGYPVVSAFSGGGSEINVGYLWGETDDHAVTKYEDIINTPLVYNASTGFYEYDSAYNAVDLIGNQLYVRNYAERGWSSAGFCINNNNRIGDFFPFNSIVDFEVNTGDKQVATYYSDKDTNKVYPYQYTETDHKDGTIDYWLGASMEASFYMPKDAKYMGQTMRYDFSGDDDVMVYLDNIMVMDLGGAHSKCTGNIQFDTGLVETYHDSEKSYKALAEQNANNKIWVDKGNGEGYWAVVTDDGTVGEEIRYYGRTIYECYEKAYKEQGLSDADIAAKLAEVFEPVLGPNGTQLTVTDALGISHLQYRFREYTKHSFNWFYMERYEGQSNFYTRFNLPILPDKSLTVGKELTVQGSGAGTEDAEFVENSLSYQFRVWKADENGKPTNELFITPGTSYTITEGGLDKGTGTVDGEGFFTLRAGQLAQFTDMLVKGEGDIYYVVEEVLPKELKGQYGEVEFEVGDSASGEVKADSGETDTFSTFYTGKISAEESQVVTFNNPVVVDKLGTLSITKTADGNVSPDQKFRMQVKLGGELLPVGTEYKIGNTKYFVESAGIILLQKDQTAVLEDKILSGTAFEVVELLNADEKFEASYTGTIDGNADGVTIGDGVSGVFGLNSTVAVTVHNKNVDFYVDIPLEKTAPGNTENATFTFYADLITSKDDLTVIKERAGVASITVTDGNVTAGSLRLNYEENTVAGKYYYMVYEAAGSGDFIYDTNCYIVEITVTDTNGLSGTVTGIWTVGETGNVEAGKISFENQKLTEIYVSKKVLGIGTTEKFQFTVKVNGTVVETFDLGNNENKTIAGIPVGATVEVVETAKSGYYAYYQIGTASNTQGDTVSITAPDSTTYIHFTNAKYTADDMVVIDYGLPVEVNVLSNDAFPDGVKVTLVSGKGTYGEAVVTNDNKIRYVLNGLTMDGTDVFTYQVTYAPVTGCETTFEAKLTIIPATTIYYEDSFVTLKTFDAVTDAPVSDGWSQVGETDDDAVQDEDRPGQSLGGLDANTLYGYDGAYKEYAQYSGGSARKTHVWNTVDEKGKATAGVYSTAEFTFKGTGFDVISMTGGKTGTIFITVTGVGADKPFSETYMVDTYYGYTYKDGEWVVSPDAADCLYQIPVMKVSGLNYGQYNVKITATYHELFDNTGAGSYDFYLDAIRIYDPANDGAGNETIEDAYVADGEGWPEYYELRNLIIAADTFNALTDNSAAVGGIVFIDGNGENSSIEDYTNFGPNNEVYLAAGQSIAFDLNAGAEFTGEIAKVQIGVKLAQGTPEASIYDAADAANAESKKTIDVNTATDLYYEITNLNGKTVVITNTGEGILSITNIKVTFKAAPTRAENPASVFSVSRETAELALASLKLAPEIFVPNNLNAKLNKNEIKVGQKVNVTVTTSRDVAYITVNGQKITTAQLNTKNGSLTWKTTVTGEEVGEMEIEIIVYSKDGVAGEPVIKVVKVQAKSNGGNTGKWPGLIKKPYDLPIGDWFN